jgi:hypothetical protein
MVLRDQLEPLAQQEQQLQLTFKFSLPLAHGQNPLEQGQLM